MFPDTFIGWIYFFAALIIVAFVIFIGRRVKRSRKQSKLSSNFKSTRRASASVTSSNEGKEVMAENTQSVSKPIPSAFIWVTVCAMSFGLIFWASVLMKFMTAAAMIALASAVLYFAVKFSNQSKYKTAAIVLLIEIVVGFAGYFTGTFDFIFATTSDWSLKLKIISVFTFVISAGVLYANWQGWTTKRVEKTVVGTIDQIGKANVRQLWNQLTSDEQLRVRNKLGSGTHDKNKWRNAIVKVLEDR
ncbi:MAG: hypothetical protein AAB778_02945 [Patescibacteria group bacterium]